MTPWKKICCAVDLSEFTPLVVRQAAELAGWMKAELVVLHVVTPPPPSALDLLPLQEEGREIDAAVQHELTIWAEEARMTAAAPVTTAVAHGSPAKEILRFAEANGVDAILVGTHGRTGLERMVLGSVAEQVVRRSSCPVVVIRTSSGARPSAKSADAAEAAEYG